MTCLQVRRARPSCELSPCLHGGTCVDLVSPPHYRCVCPRPADSRVLLGAHCEPLSSCDSMPCPEHFTCVVFDEPPVHRCVCDNDHCRQLARAVTSLVPRDHLAGACLRLSLYLTYLFTCLTRECDWYSLLQYGTNINRLLVKTQNFSLSL